MRIYLANKIGNVIISSLRLYRDNFRSYFWISLRSGLWSLLFYLALFSIYPLFIVSLFADSFLQYNHSNNSSIESFVSNSLLALLAIIYIAAYIALLWIAVYFKAKSLKNAALISRLVFGQITNKPETVQQATSSVFSKLWLFFWVQVLSGMIFSISTYIHSLFLEQTLTQETTNSLQNKVISLVIVCIYYWIYVRLFLREVTLVVESNTGINAINRSWRITKGFAWRILLINLVAFLITIPIYIIVSIIAGIPNVSSNFIYYFVNMPSLMGIEPSFEAIGGFGSIFFYYFSGDHSLLWGIIFLILNIIILPFWQSIKAVIYYDLCNGNKFL